MNIKTLSVSLTALCLSAAATAASGRRCFMSLA